jgi:hypothetical protein
MNNGVLNNRKKGTYKNVLVTANSDFLEVDTQVGWVNMSDVNFKVKFEIKGLSSLTRTIYCDGKFKDAVNGSGLFRVIVNPNVYSLFIYTSGTNNANPINISPATLGVGVYEIEVSNLNVIVNGSTVHTYVDQQINLTSTAYKPTLSKISYDDNFYSDFEYQDFEINGELFPLNEASGLILKGSNGTTGTRNTSAAGGENYINNNVIVRV